MRIVVNDIAASHGGAMTVLKDFYSCVCNYDKENEWIFLLNDRYFEETENVKILTLPEIKKSRLKKIVFDCISGKYYIQKLKPDVVFSLQNIIIFGLKIPQVVYIHQPLPFQSTKKFSLIKKSEQKLAVIQYFVGQLIKLSAKKSDKIIVQTAWMKEAVCRICHLPENKVMTNLPTITLNNNEDSSVDFNRNEFFYPSSEIVYKNIDCIRNASKILDGKGIAHSITLTLPPKKSIGNIHCIGRLSHDDVMKRYHDSTLLFPSYIETFGYPIAEARMIGTIVLASDTPFSREILKGYANAYFFDPFKPEELAELMEKVINRRIIKESIDNPSKKKEDGWLPIVFELYKSAQSYKKDKK